VSSASARVVREVPRLALSKAEAAASLGVGVDHFERHIQPEIEVIYSGRRRIFPVRSLERWVERNSLKCPV
jgi:hypothetical protein